ncbi:MAG: YggT family protein [Spirochaetales bacterium]|nr:YggT family protein [Spirochaetales bacterium]
MQLFMKLLNGLLSVYMLLLFIRVLLTWFRGPAMGKPVEILKMVTDPYLNWFRRFSFLRLGNFDFSPLLAFIVIGVVLNITSTIAAYGKITLGVVLALIVSSLWSAASFLLTIFLIIAVVRYIMYLVGTSAYSTFAKTLENMLEPINDFFRRLLFKQKFMAQNKMTGISAIVLLILLVGGNFLMRYLTKFLAELPF